MNKGIEIALGRRVVNSLNRSELAASTPYTLHPTPSQLCEHYIQILNSGDLLAAHDVTERMMAALQMKGDGVELLYGNMVKYD
jgi:hypothetical protein